MGICSSHRQPAQAAERRSSRRSLQSASLNSALLEIVTDRKASTDFQRRAGGCWETRRRSENNNPGRHFLSAGSDRRAQGSPQFARRLRRVERWSSRPQRGIETSTADLYRKDGSRFRPWVITALRDAQDAVIDSPHRTDKTRASGRRERRSSTAAARQHLYANRSSIQHRRHEAPNAQHPHDVNKQRKPAGAPRRADRAPFKNYFTDAAGRSGHHRVMNKQVTTTTHAPPATAPERGVLQRGTFTIADRAAGRFRFGARHYRAEAFGGRCRKKPSCRPADKSEFPRNVQRLIRRSTRFIGFSEVLRHGMVRDQRSTGGFAAHLQQRQALFS